MVFVLFGPNQYGGYGLIKLFTKQGLGTIKILLGNLKSSREVLRVLLILLFLLQLHAGIHKAYIEWCNRNFLYVPLKHRDQCSGGYLKITSYISNFCKFLATFSVSICITDGWDPHIQRQHDSWIVYDLSPTSTSVCLSVCMSVCLSVGLATGIPKLIHYRVVLFHTPDSGLTDP